MGSDPAELDNASVVVALLGEVCTRRNGDLVPLPGARARSLVAALARRPGHSRSAQGLIDDVWGDAPPRSPMNALHTQVSRLRAALPEGALEIGPAGYRLTLDDREVDLTLARVLARKARTAAELGDARGCLDAVARARELWRGEPGADLPDGEPARAVHQEAQACLDALGDLEIAARRTLGDLETALPLVRARADRNPLDEPAHLELMHVLAELNRGNEALDVFAALRERLADQFGADPGAELVQLNTRILRGETETRTVDRLPASIGLRAAPNALLGREDDLAAIERSVQQARVTTILGPGGAGKTRVANEIGQRIAQHRPVVLVELASLRSGDDVVASICAVLGLSETDLQPGIRVRAQLHTAYERLKVALSLRPMLLILDNCEHLVDAVADVVADLVAAGDTLSVVTTSRAPLMISAETVYPLPPLEIDEAGSPATDLFHVRARAVRPSARLDPAEVARLCRTLDGLPLAIELAAARVRTMSVEEINNRLADRFALLRSADRTSPDRHRTLRAVIDWSWQLLDPQQQAALRRLCRFPAGFTLESAAAVAEWGVVDDMALALDGLVNQSLLDIQETANTGLRYHMLETVREFGEELLEQEPNEADEVARRTAQWACEFAVRVAESAVDEQVRTVQRIEADHDNLVAVLRAAVARDDVRTTHHVFAVLATLWAMRGAHSEVFNWAPRVLALGPASDAPDDIPVDLLALSYMMAGMHMAIGANFRAFARARSKVRALQRTELSEAARFVSRLMLIGREGRGLSRLLAVGVRSSDRTTRVAALIARANFSENFGRAYFSRRDALAALVLAEQGNDVWTTAMASQHLGSLYGQSAQYAESVEYYRRALDATTTLHAHEETISIRAYLDASLIGAGRVAEARRDLADLVGTTDSLIGSEVGAGTEASQRLASVQAALAEADLAEGRIDRGLAAYRNALTIVGWPHTVQPNPGPSETMIASGVIGAHVQHGRAAEITTIAADLTASALQWMAIYPDLPQIGALGAAIGSYRIATGTDQEVGLRMLTLAMNTHARQDLPSMAIVNHLARAREVLGDARVEEKLAAAVGIPRQRAADEILDLLGR
ncbi:AAA family ATPase [Aldersonia sp. NBC_00410]|uniref:BTAD domain-containing putative transcriptional regulator n=1 Tax=Aldersonia sp. NBC_00410 TaxID=2975954 RepID=UPI002259107E|nr:BTAD domain-containing putative transcriptional regulator [Aldersonia sp. NBC_00410]MCX5041748.1 AAA family ATPase [Aldersonia sp. NBC_00410]